MFNIFPTIFEVLLVSGILVSLYNCLSLGHYSCYVCVLRTLYNIRDLKIQHRQRELQKSRRRCLSFLTGTLRSNDADDDENVKKTIAFIRKTTTRNNHGFLYISLPVFARPRRENAWFHVLWSTWTSNNEILPLSLNLDMVPRNSTPGGFAYIWQSRWVGKDWKNANSLFKWRFRCRGVTSLDLKVPNIDQSRTSSI